MRAPPLHSPVSQGHPKLNRPYTFTPQSPPLRSHSKFVLGMKARQRCLHLSLAFGYAEQRKLVSVQGLDFIDGDMKEIC